MAWAKWNVHVTSYSQVLVHSPLLEWVTVRSIVDPESGSVAVPAGLVRVPMQVEQSSNGDAVAAEAAPGTRIAVNRVAGGPASALRTP